MAHGVGCSLGGAAAVTGGKDARDSASILDEMFRAWQRLVEASSCCINVVAVM